jgi:hypothetical protein
MDRRRSRSLALLLVMGTCFVHISGCAIQEISRNSRVSWAEIAWSFLPLVVAVILAFFEAISHRLHPLFGDAR